MVGHDLLGAAMEIARTAVVTQTTPQAQNFVLRGGRQGAHIRKPVQKARVVISTVVTWVCCSMISDSHTLYGSRVCCQGRWLRHMHRLPSDHARPHPLGIRHSCRNRMRVSHSKRSPWQSHQLGVSSWSLRSSCPNSSSPASISEILSTNPLAACWMRSTTSMRRATAPPLRTRSIRGGGFAPQFQVVGGRLARPYATASPKRGPGARQTRVAPA